MKNNALLILSLAAAASLVAPKPAYGQSPVEQQTQGQAVTVPSDAGVQERAAITAVCVVFSALLLTLGGIAYRTRRSSWDM